MKRRLKFTAGGLLLSAAVVALLWRTGAVGRIGWGNPSSPALLRRESRRAGELLDRGALALAADELSEGMLAAGGAAALGNPAELAGTLDGLASGSAGAGSASPSEPWQTAKVEQRAHLYELLRREFGVGQAVLDQLRALVEASAWMGFGNPAVSRHPLSPEQCRAARSAAKLARDDAGICGSPHMVALFEPAREAAEAARLCIDQFEFPNVPCEYPLVWVRANEAAAICQLLGKRLCDAHEWEGACAGALHPAGAEYDFTTTRAGSALTHNNQRKREWGYAASPSDERCATGGEKSPECQDSDWERCGSNTFPAGSFPGCASPYGVYDQHGNVAEHMSLPTRESELRGRGETEMKGSWFAFDLFSPHDHDCRWRAPAWHATKVDDPISHFNYHLGFRCCRDLD